MNLANDNMSGEATYDSSRSFSNALSELLELFHYRNLLKHLTIRSLSVRYKGSYLGIVWTILEPFLTMAVMAVVFTAILARAIPNYPIFLFSGLIVWNFYTNSTTRAMMDFYSSSGLMTRVYVPKAIFVVATVAAALINFLLTLVILLVFKFFTDTVWSPAIAFLPVGILLLTMFNLGISMALAALRVFFSDLQSIYNVLVRLLLYLSAVFYTVDFLPENLQAVLRAIPTFQMISLFRDPIYAGSLPPGPILVGAVGWSVGALVVGVFTFTSLSNRISFNL